MADGQRRKPSASTWILNVCLGGVAGAVAKTFTAPSNRVKAVLQTQHFHKAIRAGEIAPYSGYFSTLFRLAREQGLSSLWAGNTVSCLRYFPAQFSNLIFKDKIRRMFPKYNPKENFLGFFFVAMASGSLTGICSLAVVYPLDMIQSVQAAHVGSSSAPQPSLWSVLSAFAASPGGLLNLYGGFGAAVAGMIPYRFFQLAVFDTIVGLNPYKKDKGILGLVSTFSAAQAAIAFGATVSYPYETVRRALQLDLWNSVMNSEDRRYEGTMACVKDCSANHGFYSGFFVNVVSTVGGSLALVLYDRLKAYLF